MHVTRPVIPCRMVQEITGNMYERIKQRSLESIRFDDAQFHCRNEKCSDNVPREEFIATWRTDMCTLLTLEQGPVRVQFQEWVCGRCNKRNYYSVRSDGIVPVRKHAA